jgi:hypothetical protein
MNSENFLSIGVPKDQKFKIIEMETTPPHATSTTKFDYSLRPPPKGTITERIEFWNTFLKSYSQDETSPLIIELDRLVYLERQAIHKTCDEFGLWHRSEVSIATC